MMHNRRLATLIVACSLLSACAPMLPTASSDRRPGIDKASASKAPATAFTGRVLGLDGRPVAGVAVRSYIIAAGGGNLIGHAGGNLIGHAGGNYRVLGAAAEVRTDEDGAFTLDFPATGELNVEAVQASDVKAIRMGVSKGAEAFELKLAKTGSISGRVTAPDAPGLTDFTGVDVFIPGTSYLAKTDAAGSFTISDVPAGTFTLYASKTGLGTASLAGVAVASEEQTDAPDLKLAVAAPAVTSLSEQVVGPGMVITIKGENFGLAGGKTFQVTVGGIVAADPERVDDQTIKVKVPDGAASGDVLVTVEGVPGPTQPITVLKRLSLAHNHAQVVEGKAYAFTVQGHDTGEVLVEAPPVTWEVIEGTAVTVDATGQLQAAAIGTAKVQVKRGAIASEPFTVEVVPFLYETSAFVGSGTAGGRNGQGAAADFDKPFEIALDSLGNLFVAELEGLTKVRIRKVTPDGTVSTFLSANLGNTVSGFTVDSQDRVLVTDMALNQILHVEAGNMLTPVAGRTVETTASDGDLLPGGAGTPANFELPKHLTAGGAGKLYLADDVAAEQSNDWLREVTASGVVTISAGVPWSTAVPGVGSVTAIAGDGAGGVYWAASPSPLDPCKLFRLKDGVPELVAGGGSGDGTGEAAGFGQITGIVFDADGNLILADNVLPFPGVTPSATVRRVTPEGMVTTIAGGAHGDVEGRGTSARFGVIEDLAMGADGTIYVADSGSKRIRKIKRVSQ